MRTVLLLEEAEEVEGEAEEGKLLTSLSWRRSSWNSDSKVSCSGGAWAGAGEHRAEAASSNRCRLCLRTLCSLLALTPCEAWPLWL